MANKLLHRQLWDKIFTFSQRIRKEDNNYNNSGWYDPLETMQNIECARYMGEESWMFSNCEPTEHIKVQHYVNKRYKLVEHLRKCWCSGDGMNLAHYPLNATSPRHISSNIHWYITIWKTFKDFWENYANHLAEDNQWHCTSDIIVCDNLRRTQNCLKET